MRGNSLKGEGTFGHSKGNKKSILRGKNMSYRVNYKLLGMEPIHFEFLLPNTKMIHLNRQYREWSHLYPELAYL